MRWPLRRPRARLRFEFQPRNRTSLSGWFILALACGFATEVGWSYMNLRTRTDDAVRELARQPATTPTPRALSRVYEPKDIDRESAFAKAVVTKISLPWNDLFSAIGSTQVEEVKLLSVEPDAEARVLRINGEARDIPAMLTYVSRLESHKYFSRVGLLEHELKVEAPQAGQRARGVAPAGARPANPGGSAGAVSFAVAASWQPK